MRRCRVPQGHQFSVFPHADGELLLCSGALTGRIEHLRPGESYLHRPLHQFRRGGRKQRVAPLKSF